MAVHGGKEMDLRERSVETAKGLPDPGKLYRWGIAPVGEGLTGRGEAETAPPAHVSCVSG